MTISREILRCPMFKHVQLTCKQDWQPMTRGLSVPGVLGGLSLLWCVKWIIWRSGNTGKWKASIKTVVAKTCTQKFWVQTLRKIIHILPEDYIDVYCICTYCGWKKSLGWLTPYKCRDKPPINWCRISKPFTVLSHLQVSICKWHGRPRSSIIWCSGRRGSSWMARGFGDFATCRGIEMDCKCASHLAAGKGHMYVCIYIYIHVCLCKYKHI